MFHQLFGTALQPFLASDRRTSEPANGPHPPAARTTWTEEGDPRGGDARAHRLLSLALPRLPIERRPRLKDWKDDVLLALARPGTHGPVLHAATRAAEAAGATPG